MLRQGGGALQWARIEISSLCGNWEWELGGMGCNELAKTCIVSPKKGEIRRGGGGSSEFD